MRRAVIVDIARSPFGKGRTGGSLAGIHPVDLYAQVLAALVSRNALDPALVDDVITGCANQVAEQSGNIGRQAVLAAGFPETVPALTLDRKCGSAQQAIDFAAQGIIAGAYDIVIAGGVEMMSLIPMKASRLGRDHLGTAFARRYPDGLVPQGIAAELIAAQWGISREEMDAFAARSHRLAADAIGRGIGQQSLVGIAMPDGRKVEVDEGLRPDTSVERLSRLEPVFRDDRMQGRFPEIDWSVTAGNSSQISDGAAAALIMEEATAVRLGLRPRAAITHFAAAGDDPIMMLTAIIPATHRLLRKAGLTAADIDAIEVNEAFASVPMAWTQALGVESERINRLGGAIALGHPVGASGCRLFANLLHTLELSGGRLGLVTMCESGGMANATLIERL